VRSQEKKLLLFLGGRLVGREDAGMSGLRVLRNGALAGWLLLCLARPSVAGPPPAPAPPGLITGVCSVFAGAAVASLACDHHLAGLRVRVDALRRPQIDAIDPLRVHFSLHDRASWELTKADISAGFCGKPMTLAQLRAKYGSGPRMACRPTQRHGIVQGQKQQRGPDCLPMFHPNGAPVTVDKIRLVDDSRRSLHNSHLIRTCETVAPCPFTYMVYVCDAVVLQARGMNVPVPRVVFSTDDMRSAYRQVPPSDPEMCKLRLHLLLRLRERGTPVC